MIKNIQKKMGVLSAERNYKPVHLLLMFFIFSVVGWGWEVILGYMTGGMIVNRGVLHSPLLPIYGKGVILILVLLKRFRKYPVAEFAGIILLSGCVEYFISWYLEMVYDGKRWWDYSDYWLNLNGRICAEGLILFGFGGPKKLKQTGEFLFCRDKGEVDDEHSEFCGAWYCSGSVDNGY